MTLEMPIPHTPLYLGLATFVANVLGSVADSKPKDIDGRAGQLENKANELHELVEECRTALQGVFGLGNWAGSAADSGRTLIDGLLGDLTQRAEKAAEEAKSLRLIAQLLTAAQEYYVRQATIAERIIGRLMVNPFSRPLAQLMAVMMGFQLVQMMNQFSEALTGLGADRFTALWNDADEVAGRSLGLSYTSTR